MRTRNARKKSKLSLSANLSKTKLTGRNVKNRKNSRRRKPIGWRSLSRLKLKNSKNLKLSKEKNGRSKSDLREKKQKNKLKRSKKRKLMPRPKRLLDSKLRKTSARPLKRPNAKSHPSLNFSVSKMKKYRLRNLSKSLGLSS